MSIWKKKVEKLTGVELLDEEHEILDEFILIKSLFRRTFNVLYYLKNYLFYKK